MKSEEAIEAALTQALRRNRAMHQQRDLAFDTKYVHRSIHRSKFDLHEECSIQCRSSVISQYVDRFAQTLEVADEQGNLPLHRLFGKKSSSVEDALKMIEKYPAGLLHRNDKNHFPLHIECANQCRSAIISKCIELYPHVLAKSDAFGYLPLHYVLKNEASSVEDALMMIEKFSTALQHRNVNGDLPIHIECRTYIRRSGILCKCIELHPQSLDDQVFNLIIVRVNRSNFYDHASILSLIFTIHPMSLYDRKYYYSGPWSLDFDIRDDPRDRRRILNDLLPRHVFTSKHESDYRDLNWQPRAVMMMFLLQMKIQQQSRHRVAAEIINSK
jgi:hypothetical protein